LQKKAPSHAKDQKGRSQHDRCKNHRRGGARLREQLKEKTAIDDMLDRPISDEEFAAELQKLETMIAALVAKKGHLTQPGSWTAEWEDRSRTR